MSSLLHHLQLASRTANRPCVDGHEARPVTDSARSGRGSERAFSACRSRRPLALSLVAALAFSAVGESAQAADRVIWYAPSFSGSAIRTSHLNGDNPNSHWPGLIGHSDLGLDSSTDMLFWGDNSTLPGRLMTGASDGTGVITVAATTVPGERIHDIAIDPAGTGTAYWTDFHQLHIYRSTLPNGAPTLIPTSAQTLRDIALDLRPDKGHLYVYDGINLYRSDLPNGANEVLVSGELGDGSPGQIALDPCTDRVYAIGKTTPQPGTPEPFIRRGDLSYGLNPSLTTVVDVLTGYTDVGLQGANGDHLSLALDLHQRRMYWTSYTPILVPQVRKAALGGSAKSIIATGTNGGFSGLVLDRADDSCAETTVWDDLGGATLGGDAWPLLEAVGELAVGSANVVDLTDAAPDSVAGLFLSFSSTPIPFKGGSLKPFPFFDPIILPTSAAGSLSIPFAMPSGVPAGTEIFIQYVILDPLSSYGMTLSNGIVGTTP